MYCKHCGKEIADNSTFCQYCGGKQDFNPDTNSQDAKVGNLEIEETIVDESQETPHTTAPIKWSDLNENGEYTLDQLNTYIKDGVAILQKMANDFPSITRFSHFSQLAFLAAPAGILGGLREGIQNKKLRKYLSTKIYNNMAYDELGDFLVKAAEDLSKAQMKVQKMISSSDPAYFGNVRNINDVILKCQTEWIKIAPSIYEEEITLNTGDKVKFGSQYKYWIYQELVNMDLPKGEYKEVEGYVKEINGGNGCMVFIAVTISASLLAACTLL